MSEIGLAEVVRALREEIQSAVSEGEGQIVRFEATALELEFNVGVKKVTEGKGGIKFWVLELGAGGSYSSESIQKVKLSLTPVSAGGGRIRITQGSDESPLAPAHEPSA